MKTRTLIIPSILLAALVALSAVPVLAQSPVVAKVDRTSLSTGEILLLTVQVNTASGQPARPVLPSLDGFALLGSSSGTQINYVNGNLSMAATFQYQLQPTRTGDLVIEPIEVAVDGQVYTTAPITIQVSQGTTGAQPPQNPASPTLPGLGSLGKSWPFSQNFPWPQNWPFSQGLPADPLRAAQPDRRLDPAEIPDGLSGQDLYVEARVDNLNPYQGEQVIHTFRFYQAVDLFQSPGYSAPAFTGFWHQQQEDQATYTAQAGGRSYRVTELTTVLFPTVVGELAIDPATLTIEGDLFQRGGVLQTDPISLKVKPLPPGAPTSFNGAVGRYEIQAEVDTTKIEADGTLTYRLNLAGQGNLETVPDPQWREGPEWRAFDTQASTSTRFEGDQLAGVRTYERLLVPTTTGNITLPPVAFSFFDPELERYETVSTQGFPILVRPETGGAAPLADASTGASGENTLLPADRLRPLKPALEAGRAAGTSLADLPLYWLLWALPVLLLAGHFAWSRWQARLLSDPAARRSQVAARSAYQALSAARKRETDPYQASGQALTAYLSAKLDRPVSGMTQDVVANSLSQAGVEPALIEQALDNLALNEMGRYAPMDPGDNTNKVLAETKDLIAQLEKSFSKGQL